jgi:hypothetical protein
LAMYDQRSEEARKDGFEVERPKITDCVELILAVLENDPATLVVDALDEMDEPKQLIDALSTITSRANNVVKVLVTARDNPPIMAMLDSAQKIRITSTDNKGDIRRYATEAVNRAISDHKLLLGQVSQQLTRRLIDDLTSTAGEMFLWIQCQLQRLCELKHEEDIAEALSKLSTSTLSELYHQAFDGIMGSGATSRDLAIRCFSWLLCMKEPLSPTAFLAAITAGLERLQSTVDRLLDICRGFVYLDSKSNVIRFAHHSAQEFVRLESAFAPNKAEELLALGCLAFCNEPSLETAATLEPAEKISDYATIYLGEHCSSTKPLDQSNDLLESLESFMFDEDEPSITFSIWLDAVRVAFDLLPNHHPQKLALGAIASEQSSPIFLIATFGLLPILEQHAWPADFDWNQRNECGHTALYLAAVFNHADVVSFLLKEGANPNIECGRLGSALHAAAFLGQTTPTKLLLDHGVDVRLGGKFETAVHAACHGNHEDTALAILENGFNIADQSDFDSVAEVAAASGLLKLLRKLG